MKTLLPKVMIDARMVSERLSGVSRYVILIAKGLAEQKRLAFEPVFLCQDGMESRFSGFETYSLKTPYRDLKESLILPVVLLKQKIQLFHLTGEAWWWGGACPWMVTVHDALPERYGNPVEKFLFQQRLKLFHEKAKKILTVSHFSKTELTKRIPQIQIEVIPNAIDPLFFTLPNPAQSSFVNEVFSRHGLIGKKYFFSLCNPKSHKNSGVLVRAFHQGREKGWIPTDWKLVLSMDRYAQEPGVVATGALNDPEVLALLQGASAFLFPSLYEGFGLPPLEAGAMGVPLLVSRIPTHLEVFRDALVNNAGQEMVWLNPDSISDWALGMKRVVQGEVAPLARGMRSWLSTQYSVQSFGEKMNRAYQSALT